MDSKQKNMPKVIAGASHKLILVLDGDAEGGALLARALREATPYHAFAIHSGNHALKVVQEVKPDLILLGKHLPDMQSAEVPRQLRRISKLEHVPVLSLSASLSCNEPKAPEATPLCTVWFPKLRQIFQRIKAVLTSSC